MGRYNQIGDILAGFHYDLSAITIHGKSRFPGLYIWLRDGTKIPVSIPDGCLLLQASKQLEMLTGGKIFAGFHEVVVDKRTKDAIQKAKIQNKCLWRISSTMFSSVRNDLMLYPLEKFATREANKKYPPILCYDQVMEELRAIELLKD